MKIYHKITNLTEIYPKIIVSLGTFDGVHIGHRKIISRAVELAKEQNGTSVVFTFSNHPLSVIAPRKCPLTISSIEEKTELLAELGVDVCLTIDVTPEFLKLSPDDFIQLLLNNLAPQTVIVGPNYSYGYKGDGKPQSLISAGHCYGFNVEVHDGVYIGDSIVSSTYIRKLVCDGDVETAAIFLAHPFTIRGEVIRGDGRGHSLGFPTANIAQQNCFVVPHDGVYAVKVITPDGCCYKGVANIGNNPTFGCKEKRIEVNLINYSGNLYGRYLKVSFLSRIRGEIKFANLNALTAQIQQDVIYAQRFF